MPDDDEIKRILDLLKPENRITNSAADPRSVGDFTVGEVKNLIRDVVRDENWAGSLPILNRDRKRKFDWFLVGLIVTLILGTAGYFWLWRTTEFQAGINQNQIKLRRVVYGSKQEFEMKPSGNRWLLCGLGDATAGCKTVFTPFEVSFGSNSKLVFGGRGTAFWVDNDGTDVRRLKLADGSWLFEDENADDGWTDFDTFFVDTIDNEIRDAPY